MLVFLPLIDFCHHDTWGWYCGRTYKTNTRQCSLALVLGFGWWTRFLSHCWSLIFLVPSYLPVFLQMCQSPELTAVFLALTLLTDRMNTWPSHLLLNVIEHQTWFDQSCHVIVWSFNFYWTSWFSQNNREAHVFLIPDWSFVLWWRVTMPQWFLLNGFHFSCPGLKFTKQTTT